MNNDKLMSTSPVREAGEGILAVDDERVIRLVLARVLTNAGLDNVVVATAEAALEQLRRRPFDLLLTDKNLGNTSGVDLAFAARQLVPRIGVVLMTGYASVESADALFKLGIDDYLVKPFEFDALLQRIGEVRELRRLKSTPAGALIRARVTVHDPDRTFARRLSRALGELSCEEQESADLLEALKARPPPDAIIGAATVFTPEARREIFRLRVRVPSLRIAVVGEPTSLADTMTAIGLAAHQRISRSISDSALLATLRDLLD